MGFYYSQQAGFNNVVCSAIKDHYKPNGPKDFCPLSIQKIEVKNTVL